MDKQCKKDYEAPAITVVTFKVEKGFAESGGILRSLALGELMSDNGSQYLEEREEAASEWGGGTGWL